MKPRARFEPDIQQWVVSMGGINGYGTTLEAAFNRWVAEHWVTNTLRAMQRAKEHGIPSTPGCVRRTEIGMQRLMDAARTLP